MKRTFVNTTDSTKAAYITYTKHHAHLYTGCVEYLESGKVTGRLHCTVTRCDKEDAIWDAYNTLKKYGGYDTTERLYTDIPLF